MRKPRRILTDQPERQHNGKPLWLPALALALLPVAADAAAARHDYAVRFDATLERMEVEARFARPVTRVTARARDAGRFLTGVRDCDTGTELEVRGRRLLIPDGGIDCLRYSVDLAILAASEEITAPAGIRIASPAAWLWRPRLGTEDRVRVRFDLPAGAQLAVPWDRVPNGRDTYEFGRSPQSGRAVMLVGRFPQAERSVVGTDLRISIIAPPDTVDTEALADWVGTTAENVALAYGRFPNPAVNVILVPVRDRARVGSSPVPFGRVVRDGGEVVELLVNLERPLAEFYSEWTPTHEFAHLMLPYLSRKHRWISEGFATYYQNLLLARAGRYSESTAWQRLLEGFARGRDSAPTLSPNGAAAETERSSLMKIYWSGAALALIADVELRRRSDGRESLDGVLAELQQCCLPSGRSWSGPELLAKLDGFLEQPLFMPLYERYADTAGFPDVDSILADLGVTLAGSEVRLNDAAPLAPMRRVMLEPAGSAGE